MVPEATLKQVGQGLEPAGSGWFVLNARDARWREGVFGAGTTFEGSDEEFEQLGININVLEPGQPGLCTLLAVGSRTGGEIVYAVSELARRHNAGVPKETPDPKEAYAPFPHGHEAPYGDGWLR